MIGTKAGGAGERGWIGGRYLLRQLLAEVWQHRLGVGVYTAQLVRVVDAHIE
jgi:hypothetical protein